MVEVTVFTKSDQVVATLTRLAFTCGGVGSTLRGVDPLGAEPEDFVKISYRFYGDYPAAFFKALSDFEDKISIKRY